MPDTLIKSKLTKLLAQRADKSVKKTSKILNTLLDIISESLSKG